MKKIISRSFVIPKEHFEYIKPILEQINDLKEVIQELQELNQCCRNGYFGEEHDCEKGKPDEMAILIDQFQKSPMEKKYTISELIDLLKEKYAVDGVGYKKIYYFLNWLENNYEL